jgi:hypothetical protein
VGLKRVNFVFQIGTMHGTNAAAPHAAIMSLHFGNLSRLFVDEVNFMSMDHNIQCFQGRGN